MSARDMRRNWIMECVNQTAIGADGVKKLATGSEVRIVRRGDSKSHVSGSWI